MNKAGAALHRQLVQRIDEASAIGEIDPRPDADQTAFFIQTTMNGLQLAARAGGRADMLRAAAEFAVDRLRAWLDRGGPQS